MADYGLPMESDTLEKCKEELADALADEEVSTGAIYRVTLERVMVATQVAPIFEKV